MKLSPKGVAMTLGVMWGVCLFAMTLVSASNGYAGEFLKIFTGVYPGYEISAAGSVTGLIYGFIDGFLSGYIFVWLYNKFSK
jgi:hypothetical protein